MKLVNYALKEVLWYWRILYPLVLFSFFSLFGKFSFSMENVMISREDGSGSWLCVTLWILKFLTFIGREIDVLTDRLANLGVD